VTVKRMARRPLIVLTLVVAIMGAAFWAFRKAGRWLVVEDNLQRARAIVVLSGSLPYRATEAAEIYRQGWAPELWLFTDDSRGVDEAFARLGIHHVTEEEYDQQVLEHFGVPKGAIHVLEPPTANTATEMELIARELRQHDGDRVILVTSPVHTRRVKAVWRIMVGDHPEAILRYASAEPSDPDHWWRTTDDVEAVVHELLGLINASLGFVAKPRKG